MNVQSCTGLTKMLNVQQQDLWCSNPWVMHCIHESLCDCCIHSSQGVSYETSPISSITARTLMQLDGTTEHECQELGSFEGVSSALSQQPSTASTRHQIDRWRPPTCATSGCLHDVVFVSRQKHAPHAKNCCPLFSRFDGVPTVHG